MSLEVSLLGRALASTSRARLVLSCCGVRFPCAVKALHYWLADLRLPCGSNKVNQQKAVPCSQYDMVRSCFKAACRCSVFTIVRVALVHPLLLQNAHVTLQDRGNQDDER